MNIRVLVHFLDINIGPVQYYSVFLMKLSLPIFDSTLRVLFERSSMLKK